MEKIVFASMFLGLAALGLFALRQPAAVQKILRLLPQGPVMKTSEQILDLIRVTGAGFIVVGIGGTALTLLA